MIKTYHISGLSCQNCVSKVSKTLSPLVDHLEVSLKPPLIKISAQNADISILNSALKQVGNYVIGDEIMQDTIDTADNTEQKTVINLKTYKPLILVFSYILLVTILIELSLSEWQWHRFMQHFMAGFFLVFSFFKMLDLSGFASSYANYDVLAKRLPAYGYIYPFIELGLGGLYLLGYKPMLVNSVTLAIMVFSSIGVIQAVNKQQQIRCACLGSGFNLPMTSVTIIENMLMAFMSAWMLL